MTQSSMSPTGSTTSQRRQSSVSTSDQVIDPELADSGPDSLISLDLDLGQADALRTWLLKSTVNGASCLDEPLVNQILTELAHRLDTIKAAANIRRELMEAGIDVAHLSDEQVRELGRRVSEAAQPSPVA